MRTIQIAATAGSDVQELTLKAAPARLLTFLQGAAEPAIRAKLVTIGYSEARADEAWQLLGELRSAGSAPVVIKEEDPVAQAITACEQWQSTGMIRVRAMMTLTHPEQASFIFHDFELLTGIAAVMNVSTFLSRREALENGTERKGSRKADTEALQVLESAGATKDVLKQLEKTVTIAQSVNVDEPLALVANDASDAKRMEVLRKMYAWVTAWAEMARTVITRRDQLIRLGLAKRRAPKAKAKVVTPPALPIVTPVVTPPAPIPTPSPVTPIITTSEERSPDSRAA